MANEKYGITMSGVHAKAHVLISKASALATAIDSGATASAVDQQSMQTYFGIPDTIFDDLQRAIDIVDIATNKVYSALV